MKYVSPEIEVIRFRHNNSILTASPILTESPVGDGGNGNIIDGDGEDPTFDPFA